MGAIKDPELVVAIDIGSTYSGYAWQWRSDFLRNRSNVEFNTNWGGGASQMHKTSTCILLKAKEGCQDGYDIEAFGQRAEDIYKGIHTDNKREIPGKWFLFKRFKHLLYSQCDIKGDNLLLALEPEAAAIYCINLPGEQKKNMKNLGKPGQVFLTADIGGLTADMSAVKVADDGSLKETCIAQGELIGGQNVNEAFFQVCHDSFEGDAWTKTFQKATAVELMDMEDDFEQQKVKIGTSDYRLERIKLNIPYDMRTNIDKEAIRLKQGPDIESKFQLKNGNMFFSSDFIRNTLFEESCIKLTEIIKRALENEQLRECKTVVLVGGFVESPIVVKHIREKVEKSFPSINVLVPTSPFKAVLKGAVLFGHDPEIFRSRLSRFTYGIGTKTIFKEEIHDIRKKIFNDEDQKYYCKDIFSVHVEKGQLVKLKEEQKPLRYQPLYRGLTSVKIQVYASTKVPFKVEGTETPESVMYTTDEGCQRIGEVEVKFPRTTRGTDRNIQVSMIYGGTELSVLATDEKSGKKYDAKITFRNE